MKSASHLHLCIDTRADPNTLKVQIEKVHVHWLHWKRGKRQIRARNGAPSTQLGAKTVHITLQVRILVHIHKLACL